MAVGGKKGGPQADMNMTPMIDILLVLLIIFMVVQQSLQKGVSVQVPPVKQENQDNSKPDLDQIVLEIKKGHVYEVNQQPVPQAQLKQFLTDLYAPRPRKVIFIKGDEDISYGDVVGAVDAARQAHVEIVGLVPRPDATPVPGTGT